MAATHSERGRRPLTHEWTDATTGKVTLGIIAAMALFVASLVTAVLLYATTWGYAVHF